ncbi:MAG: DUF4345 domain-containing protein [Alphaproteobacteria bacterium]|nr:DUF4345 domain-containing protein [Alphaproteobacteria bacterium]
MSERRLFQLAVALGSLIPVIAGAAGVVAGPAMVDAGAVPAAADSHFRYLSGLLFGIGLGFASTIPGIERRAARFRLLAAVVVAGGAARCVSLLARGIPDRPMIAALIMELAVTPALVLWQSRIARHCGY